MRTILTTIRLFSSPGTNRFDTLRALYMEPLKPIKLSKTKRRMQFFLAISLLLPFTSPNVTAQQSRRLQPPVGRAQIKEAERRLAELGYWTGAIDGLLDPASRSALVAYQKWEGRPITGKLTVEELDAIHSSAFPKARELGYPHVEVDIDRQVLLSVDSNDRVRVLPVSSGSDKPFIEDGETSVAYTPRGRFIVYDKTAGWETGYFGSMYYSNYISGGVAIHGSPNVPTKPASHGCIRIPMFAAREMSKLLTLGTIVLVYDKVSFVSAKSWIENPKLKMAAGQLAGID